MLVKDLGVADKTTIYVDDFNQDFKCYIEIHYDSKVSEDDEAYPNGYSFTKLNSVKNNENEYRVEHPGDAGSSTEVPVEEIVLGDLNEKINRKRKHSDLEENSNRSKRSKHVDSSESSEEYVEAYEID